VVRIREPRKKAERGNPEDVRIALRLVDECYDLVREPLPTLRLGRTEFDLSAMYKGFFDRLKDEIRKRPALVTEVIERIRRVLLEGAEAKGPEASGA